MATSNQIQNALLTEHFRYTPLTLLDDIINVVNELVFRSINAIDEGLASISPEALGFKLDPPTSSASTTEESRQDALYELKQNEIGNGIVQLESLLNATVDRDFDKFEIYTLRNILAVGHEEEAGDLAKWIQLEHYRQLDLDTAKDAPRPEDVLLQRRKLVETKKLNGMLKAEEARNAAMMEQLQALLGGKSENAGRTDSPFAFLAASEHTAKAAGGRPLEQNVQYALAQLPALRELLAQLKDSLHTLPNARHAKHDEGSKEAKRRQYLDSQSRRAVERRGIDADAASQTAAASTGRKIARDEVEGMEAVVQALGDAPTQRHHDNVDEEMED